MAQVTRFQIAKALRGLSGLETYAVLEETLKAAKARTEFPKQLPLNQIRVADKVFQWRIPDEDVAAKENHVATLVRGLEANEGKPLAPILVFPVGDKVYVLDGHHRLAAYRISKWSPQVPVTFFKGTLDEAQLEALRRNVHDKLPMTRDEKMEAAWKLVKSGKHNVPKIKDATTVSRSNIYIMMNVLNKLRDAEEDVDPMSWKRARMAAQGVEPEIDDTKDYRQINAKKMVDSLLRNNIGQGMSKDPSVTALAILMLNPELPRELIYEWVKDEPDLLEELNETLKEEAEETLAWTADNDPF